MWIRKISPKRPAGNSPSLLETSGISCINVEQDRNATKASFFHLYFWPVPRILGFRGEAANHGGTFRVSLSHCHTSTRHTRVRFQAPEHTERQRRSSSQASERGVICLPWETESYFRPMSMCWRHVNMPASPRQSQELINDSGRNSLQNAQLTLLASLLGSARQLWIASPRAVLQGHRQKLTDPWEEYPDQGANLPSERTLLSSNCG